MKRETIIGISVVVAIILSLVAIVIPSFIKARSTSCQNACFNNLRMIDAGKEQWALANKKTNGEDVVISRVNEYIKGSTTPECPKGGTYRYNPLGVDPTCSGFDLGPDGKMRPHRLPKGT